MNQLFARFLGLFLMVASLVIGNTAHAIHIPLIEMDDCDDNWERVPDVAQYHSADWSKVVGRAPNVTVAQAKEIAESHPEITYFFHMTYGWVLNLGNNKIFYHNDAVFFSGEPEWGNATGYSDGYVKKQRD